MKVEKAQYYLVNHPFGDSGVTAIKDTKELDDWLIDGSFKAGDVIIEAKRLFVVEEDIVRSFRVREEQ